MGQSRCPDHHADAPINVWHVELRERLQPALEDYAKKVAGYHGQATWWRVDGIGFGEQDGRESQPTIIIDRGEMDVLIYYVELTEGETAFELQNDLMASYDLIAMMFKEVKYKTQGRTI